MPKRTWQDSDVPDAEDPLSNPWEFHQPTLPPKTLSVAETIKEIADDPDPNYSWRHFAALTIAVLADAVQLGQIPAAGGTGGVALICLLPVATLFAAAIVLVLSLVLGGPKKQLLLCLLIEVVPIPFLGILPGFIFNTWRVVQQQRSDSRALLELGVGEPDPKRPA